MNLVTISCVDPTIGLTNRAKYFAIVTGSIDLDTHAIYLRWAHRGRYEAPDQVRLIAEHFREWRPIGIGIEETFWQVSLIQDLRRFHPDVITFPINRRKQGNADTGARAMGLAARYEQGRIFHPDRVDARGNDTGVDAWLTPFEDELLAFTGQKGRDDYTDQVSAWTDVVDALSALAAPYAARQREPVYSSFGWDVTAPADIAVGA
ncbi:MAG: hypothetical protein NUW01_14255 [Gemmatimonadaceae bacterium]|nr:hypothetical protein [Gemmatimonadaceae bacterium]